jgi:hypothetical protein
MAEDLGHIKIDFGSLSGGTTGPEPTAMGGGMGGQMETVGAAIGTAFGGPAGAAVGAEIGKKAVEIKDALKNALRQVVDVIQRAYQFVSQVASEFRERGKYSPEVMFENVAGKVQAIQQQVREAQVLGPLYAMVLRWYRELMRLLEPWKMLFQAILGLVAGVILATMNAILTELNKSLPKLIEVLIGVLDVLIEWSGYLGKASQIATTYLFTAGANLIPLPGSSVVGYLIGNAVGQKVGGVMTGVQAPLAAISGVMQSVLQGINQIATNTAPQGNGADWAASQLREIASISPLYGITGQPAYATPGGQAPFFRPPGSTYP